MAKTFGLTEQLNVGALGVEIAKSVLHKRFGEIKDLQGDMAEQKRGVDLWVEGLGYIEVKTDSHSPERVFLELDVGGKPGAVDRSTSDYFCVLFYRYHLMVIIPRPELQQWLREHYEEIVRDHAGWIKTIHSRAGKSTWSARGMAVPRAVLARSINISVLEWKEEEAQ